MSNNVIILKCLHFLIILNKFLQAVHVKAMFTSYVTFNHFSSHTSNLTTLLPCTCHEWIKRMGGTLLTYTTNHKHWSRSLISNSPIASAHGILTITALKQKINRFLSACGVGFFLALESSKISSDLRKALKMKLHFTR